MLAGKAALLGAATGGVFRAAPGGIAANVRLVAASLLVAAVFRILRSTLATSLLSRRAAALAATFTARHAYTLNFKNVAVYVEVTATIV